MMMQSRIEIDLIETLLAGQRCWQLEQTLVGHVSH